MKNFFFLAEGFFTFNAALSNNLYMSHNIEQRVKIFLKTLELSTQKKTQGQSREGGNDKTKCFLSVKIHGYSIVIIPSKNTYLLYIISKKMSREFKKFTDNLLESAGVIPRPSAKLDHKYE
jgi:hypothetical protein